MISKTILLDEPFDDHLVINAFGFLFLIIRKYGIKISDFGKSWRDGLAFNAIVHTIRPDLIDFENVRNQSARANLEQAFSTAEDHLGIARLLDPEGRHHIFYNLT